MPNCPLCHTAGKAPNLTNNAVHFGSHLLTKKHISRREALAKTHPEEYQRVKAFEDHYGASDAIARVLAKKQQSIQSQADREAVFGVAEHDLPAASWQVADEGIYRDINQFQGTSADDVNDNRSGFADPEEMDIDPPLLFDEQDAMSTCNGVAEDCTPVNELSEFDNESDSSISEQEDEDAENRERSFGENDYFPTSKHFQPPTSNPEVEEPMNEWYPFDSETDAKIFIYAHSPDAALSDAQISRVLELYQDLTPEIQLPTLKKIKSYRFKIPRPDVELFKTADGQPYYQVSILDTIRMQACIPRSLEEQGNMLRQYPEVLDDTTVIKCNELWHGSKWRWTPQLQRPMDLLTIMGRDVEVWIGDVFELEVGTSAHFGIYFGCEDHVGEEPDSLIRVIPLQGPCSESNEYCMATKNGFPLVDERNILLIRDCQIQAKHNACRFNLCGRDLESESLHPLRADVLKAMLRPHPIRQHYGSDAGGIPIMQVNISFWNDGLSSVRSSRWNPVELWRLTLAGFPRKVCMREYFTFRCFSTMALISNSIIFMLQRIFSLLLADTSVPGQWSLQSRSISVVCNVGSLALMEPPGSGFGYVEVWSWELGIIQLRQKSAPIHGSRIIPAVYVSSTNKK